MLGTILFNSVFDYLNNGTEGSIGRFADTLGIKGVNITLACDRKIVASRSREVSLPF